MKPKEIKPKTQQNPTKSPIVTRLKTTSLAVVTAIGIGVSGLGVSSMAIYGTSAATMAVANTSHALVQNDFSNLVEQVTPSVVRVNVTQEVGNKNVQAYQQIPEVWKRFFDIPEPQAQLKKGTGSGFFIGNGYVLTNHHVIDNADKITLTLNDRREIEAELVGSDKRTDVAVLKVKADDFPPVRLGNSKSVRVGEPVLAIGSPFGFDYSASAGIVSATSRSLSREDAVPFIQTDVALNPGNSGGPLFNKHGEVIGVNSRIFSGTGGYMGLSFSIPIDLAMDVFEQIRDTGTVTRPYMGIYPQDIDQNLAEVYQLDKPKGALITQVEPESGADKAGIKSGDIILEYNGTAIKRVADLINLIGRARVNDDFSVLIKRDKKTLTLDGRLGLAPDTTEKSTDKMQSADKTKSLGLKIRALTPREANRAGFDGVLVVDIDATGTARRAGIKEGDLITSLNRQKTPNVSRFFKAIKRLPDSGVVEVRIVRRGMPMIVGMRINK